MFDLAQNRKPAPAGVGTDASVPPAPPQGPPERRNGPPFGTGFDPVAFVRRWWPMVVLFAVIGMIAAVVVSRLVPPRFTATSQILVDPRGLQIFDNELQPRQQDANTGVNFVESQARVITSQSVIARVVEKERLMDDPEFAGEVGAAWAVDLLKAIGLGPTRETTVTDRDRAAQIALGERLSVRRPERTFVIDVTVRARTAEKAARLANAVSEAYNEVQAQARADQARRASQALASRLDELRERVREAEQRAEDFRRRSGLIGTRAQLISEQQLTDANTQLATAQARVAEAQARFEQTQAARSNPAALASLTEAVVSQTIASLRAQQAEARRRLADAQSDFGPRHPTVRNAQAQLADLDRAIVDELGRIAQSTRADLERTRAAEAALRRQVDQLTRQAVDAGQAFVQLRELQREADANRNLLASFLARARETGEFERLDTSNTRIITVAQPPRERSFPPRAVILMAVGLILGGLIGLIIALGLELLTARPREDDQMAQSPARARYV